MNINTTAPLSMQVNPVHLVTGPSQASEPWPVGYTMTVWGVAIGITLLIALLVTTWLRLSPHARALMLQTITWRLSPRQLLALRSVSNASGTPTSVLLISRGAFESAMTAWATTNDGALVTPARRNALANLVTRIYGHN